MTYDEYKTQNSWDGKLSSAESDAPSYCCIGMYYDSKDQEYLFRYDITYSEPLASVIIYDVHSDERKYAEESVQDAEPEHIKLTFEHSEIDIFED